MITGEFSDGLDPFEKGRSIRRRPLTPCAFPIAVGQLLLHCCHSTAQCVENPVVITIVRQTGDFGRYHLDRRKTPSPTPIGDYRVFYDMGVRQLPTNIRRSSVVTSPLFLVHFKREFSGLEKPSGKELDMKKSWYTDEQIAFALKQAETGTPVAEVIRRMGISEQTFYRWKKVYDGLGVGELRRLKQLEDENRQLKQLVADLSLDKHILQDVLSKKL